MNKTVIITGSLGFIGSHTAKAFKESGYRVIGIDCGPIPKTSNKFVDVFLHEDYSTATANIAIAEKVDIIIHIAGTSLVGPSLSDPGLYYNNNVSKTNTMLQNLSINGWHGLIVFSSSAAVYGNNCTVPIKEDSIKSPISPYGHSKLMIEQILKDHCAAHSFKAIALRYFNACGCDVDGELGNGKVDTHLIPIIVESILTKQPLTINGNDYNTPDKTCIRDYLHVTDIANAHVACVALSEKLDNRMFEAYNLGTGTGYSNLEIVNKCIGISDATLEYKFGPRRFGDPDALIADPTKFILDSNWKPKYSDLTSIVQTTYNWMKTLK